MRLESGGVQILRGRVSALRAALAAADVRGGTIVYLEGVTPEDLATAYPEAILTTYTSVGGGCAPFSIDTACLELTPRGRIHASRHREPTPEEREAATAAEQTTTSGYVFRALGGRS